MKRYQILFVVLLLIGIVVPVSAVPPTNYNLKLLLHGNYEVPSINATGDFRDSSRSFMMPYGRPFISSPSISTAQKKFGNGSIQLISGSNVTLIDDDKFTFGSNNFSISGSVYWTTTVVPVYIYAHQVDASNYDTFVASSNAVQWNAVRAGVPVGSISVTNTPSPNTWYNFTYIQNGTTGTIYVNGTATGATATRTAPLADLAALVYTGNGAAGTFSGFIDEVKVFNGGLGQNIGDFGDKGGSEYPLYLNVTPYGGYADDDYTVSLLHFTGVNGGTYFNDSAGNRSWTATAATTNTSLYKFSPSSGWFGDGSRLLSTPSTNFDFGTDNWTFDGWVNIPDTTGNWALFTTRSVYGDQRGTAIQYSAGGFAIVQNTTQYVSIPISSIPTGQWVHLAAVRSGTTGYIFVNGNVVSSGTIPAGLSFNSYGQMPGIGTVFNDYFVYSFGGLLDEVRITKGIARWTSSFTPPSTPYEVTNPAFTYSSGEGTTTLINFNDLTLDSLWTNNSFLWDFGDSTGSTLQSPSHVYVPGTYTVRQDVFNNNMTAFLTRTVTVGAPAVNFACSPLAGTAALLVTCTDLTTNSTPITTYNMSWGDGETSTTAGPWTHVYATFGAFDVNLTETNSIGEDYEYKHNYIITSTPQDSPLQTTLQYVTIHTQTFLGESISGATVNATGITTTTGSWDWLATLTGVSLSEHPINGTALYGTTDSNGDIVFLMFPTVKYNISVVKSGYTFPQVYLAPNAKRYTISANANISWFQTGNNTLKDVNVSVNWVNYNSTYAFVNVSYNDLSNMTTGGTITIYRETFGTAANYTPVTVMAITGTNITNSTLVPTPTGGSSYRAVINGTTTYGKNIAMSFSHSFKGAPVMLPGWTTETLLWLALFIVIFTSLFAGAIHAPQMAVILCVESWIFWSIGWLNYFITDMWYTEAAIIALLVLASFITVWWNITEGKAKGVRSS
jgi:PKD repeat protein